MAGDIVAGLGFKHTTTGDTLCDRTHPIVLERMEFPEPVIHVAIEPKTKVDQDKLGKALYSLSEEDPTFRVRTDDETGQTVISGMGELHLEVLVDRMLREFSVDATVGKPQVAYRETITKPVEQRRVPPRQADRWLGPVRRGQDQPRAHRSRRRLRVRRQDQRRQACPASTSPPSTRASSRPSTPACSPGTRPSTCGPRWSTASTTTSTRRRWRSRSPARWPSRRRPRWPSRCCSSRSCPSRSSRPRTTWATSSATSPAAAAASRAWRHRGNSQVIRAQVPLSEMFGYSTDLRSRTQGRATYTMQFHSYQPVPDGDRQGDRQAGAGRVAPGTLLTAVP